MHNERALQQMVAEKRHILIQSGIGICQNNLVYIVSFFISFLDMNENERMKMNENERMKNTVYGMYIG